MEKSLTKAYAILAYERMQVNEDLNIALAEMRSQCDQIISNLKTAINEGLDHEKAKLDQLAQVNINFALKKEEFEALQLFVEAQMTEVKAVFADEWEDCEEHTTASVGCVSEDNNGN